MEKIPIGLIIKKIIKEKSLSVIDVANTMGVSRQAIYQAFSRDKMSNEEKRLWADALAVDVNEFDKRSQLNVTSTSNDDYLMKYIDSLEKRIAEQERTISVLLGKSVSVSMVGLQSQLFVLVSLGTLINRSAYFFCFYLQ